ncbi:hypothetical protein PVL29_024241 [Vitis rotundifolia]|uniref:Uncharacterized protein n=1 Tax=Vitis rotundifolia TaxID=103349 RepID=A0AA38YR95_VITRO|nr:hypothetical protein PVL29_024241 [Vitis rotundifolia]
MAVPPVKTVGLTKQHPLFFPTFISLQRREDKDKDKVKDMPFRMAVTSSLARATISSTFVATKVSLASEWLLWCIKTMCIVGIDRSA